jgi:methylated-DNA-protein-cysteine methyltransferase-like protein
VQTKEKLFLMKTKNIYSVRNKAKKDPGVSVKDDITFFEKVYQVVRLIPKGRVTTYGAIAKYLGTAGSSRMVGWAMNSAHSTLPAVPAQRVVNRAGMLTGKAHFKDHKEMQRLLKKDGVEVKNDMVVNFKEIFWDPMIELSI